MSPWVAPLRILASDTPKSRQVTRLAPSSAVSCPKVPPKQVVHNSQRGRGEWFYHLSLQQMCEGWSRWEWVEGRKGPCLEVILRGSLRGWEGEPRRALSVGEGKREEEVVGYALPANLSVGLGLLLSPVLSTPLHETKASAFTPGTNTEEAFSN